MDGVALKPLTVDFHEPRFVSQIGNENNLPFWFQMSDEQRKKTGNPWGPANPQALNRYSYVQNGPVRQADPSGHAVPGPWVCPQCNKVWGTVSSSTGKFFAKIGCFFAGCHVKGDQVVGPTLQEGADSALAGLMPLGSVVTSGLGNIGGGRLTAEKALEFAEKWLGKDYKEIAEGVFRSADGLRQFRMTVSDLLDPRQEPHVHFEAISPNGREIIENSHVGITNP